MTKTCKTCGLIKPHVEFTKDPRNPDGLGANCRACYGKRASELYYKRPKKQRTEAQKLRHRKWQNQWYKTLDGWAYTVVQGCKSRKECSLTKDDVIDLWNKQNGCCAITKQPMDFAAQKYAHNKPSVDRIDGNKGYYIGNVRLVWHFVNQARNIYSDELFIKCCKAVVDASKEN